MDRTGAPFVQPTWLRAVGLVALALLVSTFAEWPILAQYPHTQGHDGEFVQEMLEAARVAWVRYHELPLWNPYQCGGVPLWDNPQGMGALPVFWPLVVLGGNTTVAMDLWYVLHAVAGFVSMYLLARYDLRLSRDASLVSAGMWAFCGAHVQRICGGHFAFTPFLLLPLALLLCAAPRRPAQGDRRRPRRDACVHGRRRLRDRVLRPHPRVRDADARVVATGALAAHRDCCGPRRRDGGVPPRGAAHSGRVPGPGPLAAPGSGDGRAQVVDGQGDVPRTDARARGRGTGVRLGEYADYVGPVLLGLSVLGAVIGGVERAWLLLLVAWTFALMSGHESPWAPWSLMKAHVFPFKEMRVPSRFNLPLTVFLAAFAGVAIDRVGEIARRVSGSARNCPPRARVRPRARAHRRRRRHRLCQRRQTSSFGNAPLANPEPASRLYLGGPGQAAFVDLPEQNRAWTGCWRSGRSSPTRLCGWGRAAGEAERRRRERDQRLAHAELVHIRRGRASLREGPSEWQLRRELARQRRRSCPERQSARRRRPGGASSRHREVLAAWLTIGLVIPRAVQVWPSPPSSWPTRDADVAARREKRPRTRPSGPDAHFVGESAQKPFTHSAATVQHSARRRARVLQRRAGRTCSRRTRALSSPATPGTTRCSTWSPVSHVARFAPHGSRTQKPRELAARSSCDGEVECRMARVGPGRRVEVDRGDPQLLRRRAHRDVMVARVAPPRVHGRDVAEHFSGS